MTTSTTLWKNNHSSYKRKITLQQRHPLILVVQLYTYIHSTSYSSSIYMVDDRKYTSIFMGVLHHVQHIIYYFIMINNVCPFPYGILFYWWSVPFSVENINCYLHTWPDSVCPLIIKYIPTKSLSSCDINYLRTFTNTDAPQNDCHM